MAAAARSTVAMPGAKRPGGSSWTESRLLALGEDGDVPLASKPGVRRARRGLRSGYRPRLRATVLGSLFLKRESRDDLAGELSAVVGELLLEVLVLLELVCELAT